VVKQNRSKQGRPIVALALQKTRSAFANVAMISAVTNLLMLVGPLFMM
jgi:ATP-binding cassette subfamily C protein